MRRIHIFPFRPVAFLPGRIATRPDSVEVVRFFTTRRRNAVSRLVATHSLLPHRRIAARLMSSGWQFGHSGVRPSVSPHTLSLLPTQADRDETGILSAQIVCPHSCFAAGLAAHPFRLRPYTARRAAGEDTDTRGVTTDREYLGSSPRRIPHRGQAHDPTTRSAQRRGRRVPPPLPHRPLAHPPSPQLQAEPLCRTLPDRRPHHRSHGRRPHHPAPR